MTSIAAVTLVAGGAVSEAKKARRSKKDAPKLVAPQSLTLGVDKSVTIRLKNAAQGVQFYTNVGQIVSTSDAKQSLEATYEPPTGAYPRVAIIVAASADHSLLTWTTLPLHGRPKIRIQSIRRADVVASVGKSTFGPVRTNAKGHARLEVVVPPGLQKVALTTTDRLGTVSKSSTALNAPDFGRVLVVCPQGDADNVLLFATNASGRPLQAASFELKSNVTLGTPVKLGPGMYSAEIPTGSAIDSQALSVTASLKDSPKFESSCTGLRPGTLPTAMRVRLAESSYTAGSGKAIQLTVELDYEDEQRRRKPILEFEPEIGSVSSLRRQTATEFVATWQIPDGFEGLSRASVAVKSKGQAKLTATAKVDLKAGSLTTFKLRSTRKVVAADGASTTRVIATLQDSYGNGVVGTPPTAMSSGSLGTFRSSEAPGTYVAVYQSPRSYSAKNVSLLVREPVTGMESTLSIGLIPAKRRLVADIRLGYTSNNGIVKSPSGSLALGWRIPIGKHYGVIGGHGGVFRSSSTEATDDGSTLDLEVFGAPMMGTLAYERVLRHLTVYAGVGGGVVYSRTKLDSMNTGTRTVVKLAPGGGALFGARVPLGPGHLVSQLSYWTAPIDSEGVEGDLLGLAFEAGYGFDL
jgi:hypothetical protein